MILSRAGMAIITTLEPRPSAPSLPPPPKTPSASDVQPPKDPPPDPSPDLPTDNSKGKGKAKAIARKPWADEPWPLIEPLSRTQRITHSAHHIANELSHTHNAMLRGLNALYLQAPFVRDPVDVADFLFLARVWSGWVLDYHEMKESAMLPGFEAVLGLERGILGGREKGLRTGRDGGVDNADDADSDNKQEEKGGKEKDIETPSPDLPTLLQNLHSYAVETHPQPSSYAPSTLRTLLTSLASVLVPHLHNQIPTLLHMQELCTSPRARARAPPSTSSLPSLSPSPSPSQPSTSTSPSISTPPSCTPSPPSKSTTSIAAAAPAPPKLKPRKPRRTNRASSLTQTHLAAESAFHARADRYTVAPLAIRLRDTAYDGGARLSVPAIHAVADRLSPRHAGAWRFLPCDVWGRRRELAFLEIEIHR
ncbi:hypothetical protein F4781DRAFT_439545 [Annulohypoxylon bovei var. microspora]|nr:hypothetical protein F4781DRAFT_439545 [Annulohypoxylon bovei var. microspora]